MTSRMNINDQSGESLTEEKNSLNFRLEWSVGTHTGILVLSINREKMGIVFRFPSECISWLGLLALLIPYIVKWGRVDCSFAR